MNNKIKVLHIANGDDCLGSAQCLYEILNYELNTEDIEPILLTPKYTKMNEFCDEKGIENYSSKYCGFMYPMHDKSAKIKFFLRKIEYFFYNVNTVKKISKLIDFNNIDVIHTNNSLNDIGAKLSFKYSKVHFWHLREGGLYPQNLRPYFKGFASYMTKGHPYFIAVSNSVKNEWIKLGIPGKLINVIYDGVDLPREIYLKHTSDKVRFVMTGAYSEIKGQIQVIKAVSGLSEDLKKKIKIDFWGNGVPEYVDFLESEIKRKGLSEIIHLKGFTRNVWETLSHYDVGLNCTRQEAFGRTTVEFLISGMPVIASNLGANVELINKTNGIFYEYNNVDELRKSIIYMIDHIDEYKSDDISSVAKEIHSSDISNMNIVSYFRKVVREN